MEEEDNWIQVGDALAKAFADWEKTAEAELATQFSEDEFHEMVRCAINTPCNPGGESA
jgi:hypothetical protein